MQLSQLTFDILGKTLRIQTDSANLTGAVTRFSAGPPFATAPEDDKYTITLLVGSTEIHFHNLTRDTEVDTQSDL